MFGGPRGSILEPFWLHFEAPGLHFGVMLRHILPPKGSILESYTSDSCSFRFCSFHKNLVCLILSLLSVLQKHSTHRSDPNAKNFQNHFINTSLAKTSRSHRGRRYREAFYDNFVPDNVVRAAAWHAPHVNITVNRLPAPPACHWWK